MNWQSFNDLQWQLLRRALASLSNEGRLSVEGVVAGVRCLSKATNESRIEAQQIRDGRTKAGERIRSVVERTRVKQAWCSKADQEHDCSSLLSQGRWPTIGFEAVIVAVLVIPWDQTCRGFFFLWFVA